MPLYDYRCHRCGETFEVKQSFADAVLTVHENCGGELERLISLPAIQFKGTGWYVTDYGRNGKTPSQASNGKSDSKSDGAGDSKSQNDKSDSGKNESKADTKSETKTESKAESKPAPASTSSDK